MELKIFKNFIKKTEKTPRFFYTGISDKTYENKFDYIKSHFQYYTLNSWNRLKSIANNVKIYKLGLTTKQQNAFYEFSACDSEELYTNIGDSIKDFENIFTSYVVGFNGRSGGYMVLYNKSDNNNVLEENVEYSKNYTEYYEICKEEGVCRRDINNSINEMYYLLKAFDKLCDICRGELIYILDNAKIEEHEETYTKLVKSIVY